MMTHGTQRITDLRRGSWQITSMTRGTFDILGRFSSPYSHEATEALQAAFPNDWETIRDYGWQHPEIVPWVNIVATTYIEEDPHTIYSLIPTLGVFRTLKGDGYAHIATGVVLNQDDEVSVLQKPTAGNTAEFIFGARVAIPDDMYYFIYCNGNTKNISYCYWDNPIFGITTDVDIVREMKIKDGKCYSNGELVATLEKGNFTTPSEALLFTAYANGSAHSMKFKGYIAHCIIKDKKYMIPIQLGVARTAAQVYPSSRGAQAVGTKGMIDLVTGLFHPNVATGSFTISESPAA